MERQKAFLGWKCTLSAEEVQTAQKEFGLSEYVKKWKSQPDGTATLRVSP